MSPSCKKSRLRLEQWLWRKVDSNACPGVKWVDRAQRTFQIPWINQKKSEWREESSQLFTEYAIHKGKLTPGVAIEHPKCKQNFKSAIGKCTAVKRLRTGNSKNYRLYMFKADYSLPDGRNGGRYQQTRQHSSENEGDTSKDSEELGDVLTWPEYDLPFDFLQGDSGNDILRDIHNNNGSLKETLQGDDLHSLPLADVMPVAGMVEDLHLSPHWGISTVGNSQIQNTTVDSTTGNQNNVMSVTSDEQNLTVSLQAQLADILNSCGGISTHSTNSKMSMAGCKLTVHTDKTPGQLLYSQLGDRGHKTIQCNNSEFVKSMEELKKTQTAVTSPTSSQQSLPSSSLSMETSVEPNNQRQREAALPTSVTSSTPPETTIPHSLPSPSPGVPVENLMTIQIIYSSPQRVVKKEFITSNKCKIFFGRVTNKGLQKQIEERDNGAVLVELPQANEFDFDKESKDRITKTLDTLKLGVVISYRNNDIYVLRRCQSKVFLTDGVSTSVPLPRSNFKEPDQEEKAFDFAAFEKSVANYQLTKTGTVDRDHFVLTLGCEILQNDPSPTRVVPIRIDVQHWKAAALRYHALGQSAYTPEPQKSITDSFDNQLRFSSLPMCLSSGEQSLSEIDISPISQ